MNVYMLTTQFSPETVGNAAAVQSHVEATLRDALSAANLSGEFARVSQPYPQYQMQMAVVCTEAAAAELRQHSDDLGIESLILDKGRTANLQAANPSLRPRQA